MRLTCFVACLFIVSTCSPQSNDPAHPQGRIVGSVVNDLNEPVASAILCTSIVRTNTANTTCGADKVDKQGHFDISVPLETNRVFAQNPDVGLQPPSRPMEEGIRVELTESKPVAEVTLQIGPRPAEIDLSVTDKATGKPIRSFKVRWIRLDDAPASFIQSTKSPVFVPPNVDVLLMVQAHGYKSWFFTDLTSPSHPVLNLSSGDQRTVTAELEPD